MSLFSATAHAFGPDARPGCPGLRSALRRIRGGFVVLAALAISAEGLLAQDETDPSIEMTAHHPLTGAQLPGETPYPVRGVPGDGRQDDIPVSIVISYEAFSEPTGPSRLARDLRDALLSLQIRFGGGGELDIDPGWHVASVEGELDRNINPWGGGPLSEVFAWEGVIPAGIDVPLGRALRMEAVLFRDDVPIDTFTTEIRPGMPELRFRSTIISQNIR
jgi:hypothetical protein